MKKQHLQDVLTNAISISDRLHETYIECRTILKDCIGDLDFENAQRRLNELVIKNNQYEESNQDYIEVSHIEITNQFEKQISRIKSEYLWVEREGKPLYERGK